jgi:hypothetical protein
MRGDQESQEDKALRVSVRRGSVNISHLGVGVLKDPLAMRLCISRV